MLFDRYQVTVDKTNQRFDFNSEGPNGIIRKTILYQHFAPNIFNLSFGDWNNSLQIVDDRSRSNNEDRDKILRTVAFTALLFLTAYPAISIIAEGSTPARTRLYQMAINKNWAHINKLLNVMGHYEDTWERFIPGKNYEAFLITLK